MKYVQRFWWRNNVTLPFSNDQNGKVLEYRFAAEVGAQIIEHICWARMELREAMIVRALQVFFFPSMASEALRAALVPRPGQPLGPPRIDTSVEAHEDEDGGKVHPGTSCIAETTEGRK